MNFAQKITGLFNRQPAQPAAQAAAPPPAPVAPAPAATAPVPALTATGTAGERRRARVVTYADARADSNSELVAEMEKVLDVIDRGPDSYEAVASFAGSPMGHMSRWSQDLGACLAQLPASGIIGKKDMIAIEKFGLARLDIMRDINLHLGAVPEALRRYNEEYIPQGQRMFAESGDPEDQLYLRDVMQRKENMIDRATILEGLRASAVIVAQQLRQIMECGEGQRSATAAIKCAQEALGACNKQLEHSAFIAATTPFTVKNTMALDRPLNVKKPLSLKPMATS